MRYVTHCPSCGTAFKIVDDQLRIAQGWVRCGHCQAVYKAKETLSIVVDDEPPQSEAHSPATPTPTATAATTRTNASTAHASASAQAPTPKVISADPHAASAPVQVPCPTDESAASEAALAPVDADAHDALAQNSPIQKTSPDISDEASPATALHEEEGTVAPQPVASNSNMLDRIAAIVAAKKAALSKARPKAHAHSSAAANTTPESPPTDDHPTEPPKAHANNTAPLLLEAPTDAPKALPAPTPSPDAALLALTHTIPQKNEAASATESAPATLHTDQASDTSNNKHARLTSAASLQTADGLRTNTSSTNGSPRVPAPLPSPDTPPMLEWEPLTEAAAEPPIKAPAPASAPSAQTTQATPNELPSSAVLPWQEGEPFPNSQPIVPLALTRVDDEAPSTPATDAASSPNTAPSAQQPEAATEPGNSAQQAADTAHRAASAAPVTIEASETDKAPDPDIATAHTIPASGSSTEPQSRTSEASKHSGLPSDPIDTDEVAAPSPNQASYQTSQTDRPALAAHTSANTPGTALASASSTPEAKPAVEKDKAADAATVVQSVPESAPESSPSGDATHHGQDQERSTSASPKAANEAAAVTNVPANSGLAQSAHTAQAAAVPNKDATAPSGDNSSATSTSAAPAAKTESDAEALLRRRALREKRRLKSKSGTRRKRSSSSKSAHGKKPRGLKALWQALLRPFKRTPPAAPPVPVQPPALPVPAVRPAATPAVIPAASDAPAPSSHALPATPVASTSSAKANQAPLLASNSQAAASADTHKASAPASYAHHKAAPNPTAADTTATAHSATKDEAVVPAATPVAAIQATTPSATDAPPAAATASHDESFAFMRDAQRRAFWRKPQVRAGLAAGILLGALTLTGQWAYQNRSPLAARMPLARATFEALRLPVPPWQNIQAIEIEDSDFLKNPDNSYQLRVSLRNSSTHPVAMPALELALLDDDEQVVTRRVVQADPALPMPAVIPPRGQWQATVEVWVQLPPELAQRDIAGYRVAVFYP